MWASSFGSAESLDPMTIVVEDRFEPNPTLCQAPKPARATSAVVAANAPRSRALLGVRRRRTGSIRCSNEPNAPSQARASKAAGTEPSRIKRGSET